MAPFLSLGALGVAAIREIPVSVEAGALFQSSHSGLPHRVPRSRRRNLRSGSPTPSVRLLGTDYHSWVDLLGAQASAYFPALRSGKSRRMQSPGMTMPP